MLGHLAHTGGAIQRGVDIPPLSAQPISDRSRDGRLVLDDNDRDLGGAAVGLIPRLHGDTVAMPTPRARTFP